MENLRVIDDFENDVEAPKREVFEITSLSGCDWCFEKLRSIKASFMERKAYAEEEILKYKQWLKAEEQKANDDIKYFEGLIQIYTDRRLEEDKNFKLKTAKGSASYGKLQTKFEWVDEDKVLKFLEDNELYDFIEVKKSIKKSDFKKKLTGSNGLAVDENGEIVEGIVSSEFRNFNVKY